MNSIILNIWRENSSYLRYGDTKLSVLFAIGTSLIALYSREIYAQSTGIVNFLANFYKSTPDISIIFPILILAATLICALMLIPTLSGRNIRVNFVLYLVSEPGGEKAQTHLDQSVVFFRSVARRKDAAAYHSDLIRALGYDDGEDAFFRDMSEQIWIVSRIGAAKHIASQIVTVMLFIGLLYNL